MSTTVKTKAAPKLKPSKSGKLKAARKPRAKTIPTAPAELCVWVLCWLVVRRKAAAPRMGRPTKLTEAMLASANEYYKKCKDDKETPYVEELAIYYMDVDRSTIWRWVKSVDDEEFMKKQTEYRRELLLDFCNTIKKLATMQLFRYKKDGKKDRSNAVLIFLMKADHGMVETTRHELTGADGQPIQFKPIQVMSIRNREE